MSRAFTTRAARDALDAVAHQQEDLARRNKGRQVRILVGKYAGRTAIITGVIPDLNSLQWLFCCMVLRADGSGKFLNADGESRQYRPPIEFHDFTDAEVL